MKKDDVVFDENYCIYNVGVQGQKDLVTLTILDDLTAADEVLRDDYKERIAQFVNSSDEWFSIALDAIKKDVGDGDDGIKLMTVYVLFEQNSDRSIFGLLFNLDSDREHGKGMQLSGESFDILNKLK